MVGGLPGGVTSKVLIFGAQDGSEIEFLRPSYVVYFETAFSSVRACLLGGF